MTPQVVKVLSGGVGVGEKNQVITQNVVEMFERLLAAIYMPTMNLFDYKQPIYILYMYIC